MHEVSDKPVRADARAGSRASVAAVAAGTFTVVTAEMAPVALLTPIGASLGVGAGAAGWTLTATGVVAAVTAPLVPRAAGRADRRTALIVLMLLLAAANLLAAWAPNFGVLLAARVLVGLGMGGVWALAAGLAPRLVPPPAVAAATSTIFGGVAAASVLGVPAAAFVEAAAGWRAAFVAVACLAAAVAAAMAALLPRLPAPDRTLGGRAARRLGGRPAVATGLAVTALLVTGHFAAYTFVRPVLEETAGLGPGAVGTLLLLYGIAGVAGNVAAGLRAPHAPRATLAVLAAGVAGAVALVPLLGTTHAGASALMVVWGLAYGGVSVGVQTWLLAAAPDDAERVTALFVGVFNGGIALGAFAGGLVADGAGTGPLMALAAALAAAALAAAALAVALASRGAAALRR
ncbi:MFS transporter [Actinomadura rifamycini]|uniref:MFS transporter n=1 Tax=Actinomadura rifamycini TaxID=31962 RepID=UPI0012F7B73E|nr:MFS transporter [Actinomadura rifamycini]